MRKIIIGIVLMFFTCISVAQEPMKWSYNAKKVNDTVYDLYFSVDIDPGWFIYSQFNPVNGPMPTAFKFADNPSVLIDKAKLKEVGTVEEKFDSAYGVDIKFYRNKVNFVKRITLKKAGKTSVYCTAFFMGCNEQMCLPPQEAEFKIELK